MIIPSHGRGRGHDEVLGIKAEGRVELCSERAPHPSLFFILITFSVSFPLRIADSENISILIYTSISTCYFHPVKIFRKTRP